MDNTKKFSGLAEEYSKSRPGYPNEFIEDLYSVYGFSKDSVIADIGSGTGKFAKYLLDKGSSVLGVEPNDDMRLKAEKELSSYDGFISVAAEAENTSLENSSVDHITVAQAFHWFDVKKFRNECSRILKTDGKTFLIWNIRSTESAVNGELSLICAKYCPNFKGFNGGIKTHDKRIREFFADKYEYVTYGNPLYFNRENFIDRTLSSSYSLRKGDVDFKFYLKELNCLFDKYERDGKVRVENLTAVYFGKV